MQNGTLQENAALPFLHRAAAFVLELFFFVAMKFQALSLQDLRLAERILCKTYAAFWLCELGYESL